MLMHGGSESAEGLSLVVSKLKDLSRSQPVTYTVKVLISRKLKTPTSKRSGVYIDLSHLAMYDDLEWPSRSIIYCKRYGMRFQTFVFQFLPRDAMLARYMLSSCVCPSVCLSVTCRYCIKTAERRITQTTPYDSPGTLVFWCQNIGEIATGSPPTGAPNRGEVVSNTRFSTNISLYLRNDAR